MTGSTKGSAHILRKLCTIGYCWMKCLGGEKSSPPKHVLQDNQHVNLEAGLGNFKDPMLDTFMWTDSDCFSAKQKYTALRGVAIISFSLGLMPVAEISSRSYVSKGKRSSSADTFFCTVPGSKSKTKSGGRLKRKRLWPVLSMALIKPEILAMNSDIVAENSSLERKVEAGMADKLVGLSEEGRE